MIIIKNTISHVFFNTENNEIQSFREDTKVSAQRLRTLLFDLVHDEYRMALCSVFRHLV